MSDYDADDDRPLDLEARRREERRAPEEAGEGESEGFELAEDDLVEHASHGDEHGTSRITQDAGSLDEEDSGATYGEADDEEVEN
jgi:hypothetical protein